MLFVHDKTAADGIIGFAVNSVVARKRSDTHTVFMQRQIIAAEHHATFPWEVDFMAAIRQQQALTLFDIADKRGNAIDIHAFRRRAGETHNNGDIGMVTFAGQGERAINVHGNARHAIQHAVSN